MEKNNIEKPPFSSTFCVYPWMEFMFGPDKLAKVCCVATAPLFSKEGDPYFINEVTPEKIWNSEGMREVRRKMLSGEKNQGCERCYYQESIGMPSYRESFSLEWLRSKHGSEILERVKESRKNGHRVESPPMYLDIRPGNFCNLKCRMCNPANSTLIYQEQKELLEKEKEFSPLINKGFFENDDSFYNWHKTSEIWDVVYKWAPHVKRLYFTGGEPTLIEKNWEFIDHFQREGYSKEISLMFNINCTYVPEKLLDTFDHFDRVHFSLSVDGYGQVQEYIRHPSKWNMIEKNIIKILKRKKENVTVLFSPVVQIYNILHLTDLFKWIDQLQNEYGEIDISLLICTDPEYLDIAILPQNIKKAALKRIHEYEENCTRKNKMLSDHLPGIKNILKSATEKNKEDELKNFLKYTAILDEKRGNEFKKTFSELYEHFLNE